MLRSLPVVEREEWPDGSVVEWVALPFPYERKPLTYRSDRVTQARVPLAELIATQRRATKGGIDKVPRNAARIRVGRTPDGRLYILDGHHRAAAALLRGDASIAADVVHTRENPMRPNPATPETAASLLDSITLDSKGRVKGSAEELERWLRRAIADSLPPGGAVDRYGNYVYEADVNGEPRKFRYHFMAQRVQFQTRVGGDWVTRNSYPFKDLAQRVYANLAKLAGREEAREQAKAGAKVRKETKARAQDKLAQRKERNSRQGLQGIQLEVEHPELVRRLVLEQDMSAAEETRPLLQTLTPAPSNQPPPRGFYLAHFALPIDKAPSMAWTAQLPTGDAVSVAQVPVKNERARMVTSCDLHIGRAGNFGLMVSPRKHSVSFSPAAFKGQGPGYLSATWDFEQLDVDEGARIRSELFFVIAHEKRKGIGRELVRLWLEAARMVTGGGKRMDLRIVSIVDDAWPFWLQLAKEGLYEVLQATPTSLRVR